jgi:hypothetical protein
MTALGFGPSPRPQYIYLNRQYPPSLWYFWSHITNNPIPIDHGALTGVLTKVEINFKEFRGKSDPKIELSMRCDRYYKIQIGLNTVTAKGLISALATIEDFTQPITIVPEAGDTEQVLFAKVAIDGEFIFAPYDEEADWPVLVQGIIDRLEGHEASRPIEAPRRPTLPAPSNSKKIDPRIITDQQRSAFVALVRSHGWSVEAVKAYLSSCGYTHSSTITPQDYEGICDGIRQDDTREYFESKVTIAANQLGTWEDAA